MTEDNVHLSIDDAFRAYLNSSGYGFQAAVARLLRGEAHVPSWRVVSEEMPVKANGNDTRIDILLESTSGAFAVVECKRADPKRARWCFARSGVSSGQGLYVDVFNGHNRHAEPRRARVELPYQVARDLRVPGKVTGDGHGSNGSAIESAATQVLRCSAGFLNLLGANQQLAPLRLSPVIPVIVTTASLYATDNMLSEADIESGELSTLALRAEPWVWYSQNVSPSLLHELPGRWSGITDLESFTHHQSRLCAIVQVTNLVNFLTEIHWHSFLV